MGDLLWGDFESRLRSDHGPSGNPATRILAFRENSWAFAHGRWLSETPGWLLLLDMICLARGVDGGARCSLKLVDYGSVGLRGVVALPAPLVSAPLLLCRDS